MSIQSRSQILQETTTTESFVAQMHLPLRWLEVLFSTWRPIELSHRVLMLFFTREWCSMIYVIILHFPPLMFVLKVIWNTLPLANYLLLAAMHCSVGLRVRASKAAGKKEGGREGFIAYAALCHGHVAWKPLSISVNCLWLKAFLIGYAKTQFEVFAQAIWICVKMYLMFMR